MVDQCHQTHRHTQVLSHKWDGVIKFILVWRGFVYFGELLKFNSTKFPYIKKYTIYFLKKKQKE